MLTSGLTSRLSEDSEHTELSSVSPSFMVATCSNFYGGMELALVSPAQRSGRSLVQQGNHDIHASRCFRISSTQRGREIS